MSRILHVSNSFDPSADMVRAVRELNKHSRHEHRVIVHDAHPCYNDYQFEAVPAVTPEEAQALLKWADAVLYQFVGYERGWGILTDKPCAFRNVNIYYNHDLGKFWSDPEYNCGDLSPYKLLASSHKGAKDFLPGCVILPDLIDIFDEDYLPNFDVVIPCVSYIKHASELDKADFGVVPKINLLRTPHRTVLRRRREETTCVIDNVCDGHYGLVGLEGMSHGLVTVVFNHPVTQHALREMAPEYPPFVEVKDLSEAVAGAVENANNIELRKASRQWMEKFYNSKRLVELYWEPFIDELLLS